MSFCKTGSVLWKTRLPSFVQKKKKQYIYNNNIETICSVYKVYLDVLTKIFLKYLTITIFACFQVAFAAHQSLKVAKYDLNSAFS